MTHINPALTFPRPFSWSASQVLEPERAEKSAQRYLELIAGCQMPANRQLQWHLRDNILPGLAIYQMLRAEGQSQEMALAVMHRVMALNAVPYRKRIEQLGRLPLTYPLLRIFIRAAMRQYPSEGWEIAWKENSSQAIQFHMRSCFYFDRLTQYGAPELTAAFCGYDDLVYDQVSPYLVWKRTQTIGRGAEFCDFCFARAARSA